MVASTLSQLLISVTSSILRLLQYLIIYLFAVWTCKILDLCCHLLKSVIPELPAAAPSHTACGSNNELAVAGRSFACLTSKVWLVCLCYIPAVCSRREEGEEFALGLWLVDGGRGGGHQEKGGIIGSSQIKLGVGCHVKNYSKSLEWTMSSAGRGSRILLDPMEQEQCLRCFPRGVWFQDQLEQIWACTAVERGSPAFQPTLCFGQDAFPRHTP